MLTVEVEGGKRHSICYSTLRRVDFAEGIIRVQFSGERVEIHGANLGLVHHALTNHRLVFLRSSERSPRRKNGASDAPTITSIKLQKSG